MPLYMSIVYALSVCLSVSEGLVVSISSEIRQQTAGRSPVTHCLLDVVHVCSLECYSVSDFINTAHQTPD